MNWMLTSVVLILVDMEGVLIHLVDLYVNVKSALEEVCVKRR